jgi:hypothetical protein
MLLRQRPNPRLLHLPHHILFNPLPRKQFPILRRGPPPLRLVLKPAFALPIPFPLSLHPINPSSPSNLRLRLHRMLHRHGSHHPRPPQQHRLLPHQHDPRPLHHALQAPEVRLRGPRKWNGLLLRGTAVRRVYARGERGQRVRSPMLGRQRECLWRRRATKRICSSRVVMGVVLFYGMMRG